MPLDHVRGERVEGMDSVYVVAPFDKWAEQTNLTTRLKQKRKFRRDKIVDVPIVRAAFDYAAEAFAKKGLRIGSDIDILCQEYVRTGVLTFIFCARINSEDYYVTAPFKLGEEQIRDLTLRGLWTPYRLN
jgi:hypothetical protein